MFGDAKHDNNVKFLSRKSEILIIMSPETKQDCCSPHLQVMASGLPAQEESEHEMHKQD